MSAGDWRIALADALDEQAATIHETLDRLDDVHELVEARGNGKLCHELRAVASALRSEVASITTEARELRATPGDRDGFSIAATSRHVRRPP